MDIVKLEKHKQDQMTPMERIYAYEHGEAYDRLICTPFIGNMKAVLCGVSAEEYAQSVEYMITGEILAFNRFGYDRMSAGPNSVGISTALAGELPEIRSGRPKLDEYGKLGGMDPVNAWTHPEIAKSVRVAAALEEQAHEIVPVEASIGGPFTIASFLRGIEVLLRDYRKNPEEVHSLMRIIVDSQKSCIDVMAEWGVGIAMADPVANPGLIGPKLYEKFVFPYTKELTEYAFVKTGKKVSLHMCGETYKIWQYIEQYPLNEISLDNIVDLARAAEEMGSKVPIAGNVDPVQRILYGNKEAVYEGVRNCIEKGSPARAGFHLTTGCDVPDGTEIQKMDWFMEAARLYGKGH